MIYCFDVDGVVATIVQDAEYANALPICSMIRKVNHLYEHGHRIIFQTARGDTTGINWRELTEKQFDEWGLKYHELRFEKPTADFYIDDKGINARNFRVAGVQKDRPSLL